MKLYNISTQNSKRIASPLPLDTTPTEYGETLVDKLLTEEMIAELNNQYHFVDHLGGGMWGIAFSMANGHVFKITTDESEYKASEEIIGLPSYAPFVKIHEVGELNYRLYYIIKDRVKPLDENEQALFSYFVGDSNGVIDEYVWAIWKQEGKNLHLLENRELIEKFEGYIEEAHNYPYEDMFNTTNIGWNEEGELVCFDPRADSYAFA